MGGDSSEGVASRTARKATAAEYFRRHKSGNAQKPKPQKRARQQAIEVPNSWRIFGYDERFAIHCPLLRPGPDDVLRH